MMIDVELLSGTGGLIMIVFAACADWAFKHGQKVTRSESKTWSETLLPCPQPSLSNSFSVFFRLWNTHLAITLHWYQCVAILAPKVPEVLNGVQWLWTSATKKSTLSNKHSPESCEIFWSSTLKSLPITLHLQNISICKDSPAWSFQSPSVKGLPITICLCKGLYLQRISYRKNLIAWCTISSGGGSDAAI